MRLNRAAGRRIAKSRIYAYDTIVGVLTYLPDVKFLEIIKSDELKMFLETYHGIGHPKLTSGTTDILNYVQKVPSTEDTVEALAVDRTKLIRAPQKGKFRPPYESQYGKKKENEALLAQLRRAYAESGYSPASAQDTADFLLLELDFMKMLIDKEYIAKQKEFMTGHLGSWISSYTRAAAKEAETDFYKGWMEFLEGFIDLEMEYLGYEK